MSNIFPFATIQEVIDSLKELLTHQHEQELLDILNECNYGEIKEGEYDNWNGGTYYYYLPLDMPIPIYAHLENNIEKIVEKLSRKLKNLNISRDEHHILNNVQIFPTKTSAKKYTETNKRDIDDIWGKEPDRLRVFISHITEYKTQVSEIKKSLMPYGVSCFVAHEDIQVSKKWREQIELGLDTMDALIAIITPKYHESKWTDQEVGWALGKGSPIFAVCIDGSQPYGFIAETQVSFNSFHIMDKIVDVILKTFLQNPQTSTKIRTILFKTLSNSPVLFTKEILAVIETLGEVTQDEFAIMCDACNKGKQIDENNVIIRTRMDKLLISHEPNKKTDELPF